MWPFFIAYFCKVLKEFKKHIEDNFPELRLDPILIASSGGVDSMVLTDLCLRSGLNISIAHCNFQLRGVDSDRDQEFVQAYAKKQQLPFHTISFNTKAYKESNGVSTQIAARELRYDWFEKLIEQTDCKWVLTAHQADDSLESFFVNLSRGTGINGLVGIPEKRTHFRRPLLQFTREEILKYARKQGIQWREDASNSEDVYLRNYIRNQFMGEFSKLHPTALKNLSNTIAHLKETSSLLESYKDELKSKLFSKDNNGVIAIEIDQLLQIKPLEIQLYQLFSSYGFYDPKAIISLTETSSGKSLFSSTHQLLKDRTQLLLQNLEKNSKEEYVPIEHLENISEPIELHIEKVNAVSSCDSSTIYLDLDQLKLPLVLRTRRKGDLFYPFGMKGSKKLSKYFKDEKIDQFSKNRQWLLCDSNDQIIWVVGKRFDRRFSVSYTSSNILKISL